MQYQSINSAQHNDNDGLDVIEELSGEMHHGHNGNHPHTGGMDGSHHTHQMHHNPNDPLNSYQHQQHAAAQLAHIQQQQLAQFAHAQHGVPHGYPLQHHLQHPSHAHEYDAGQLQHVVDQQLQMNSLQHLTNSAAAQLHPSLVDDMDDHHHQLEKQVVELEHDTGVHEYDGTPGGKKRKHTDKSGHFNVCLAVGCERQIKQRRLCPMHQKQKERNGGKIELKENIKFAKGRTPTPFSKHANKYAKLKTFDKKIDEWAGGKEEGTLMLDAYLESSYHQNRFPKQEDSKIYEQIGRNIVDFMKQLPEKSPLRRPLIKAMSEGVPLARLREVLPVSKQTVINSKKLLDQDNLLLTIKYKPNVTRSRKRGPNGLEIVEPMSPTSELMSGQLLGQGEETIVNAVVSNEELANFANAQMAHQMGMVHHGFAGVTPQLNSLQTVNVNQ